MFEIKYRIVDDFHKLKVINADNFNKEWDQITGFFQMSFGEHQEGSYYHDNTLRDDEEGDELLDYWFDKLLKVVGLLNSTYMYVAFKELETVNRWLEFRRQGDNIFINIAIDELCKNNNLFITKKEGFSYIPPLNFKIPYECLKNQILDASTSFLKELKCLNQELESTTMFSKLAKKVSIIQQYDEI